MFDNWPKQRSMIKRAGVFNSREIGGRAAGSTDEASKKRKKSSCKGCGADDAVANGDLFELGQGLFLEL